MEENQGIELTGCCAREISGCYPQTLTGRNLGVGTHLIIIQ